MLTRARAAAQGNLEQETGLEPATFTLKGDTLSTELLLLSNFGRAEGNIWMLASEPDTL